MIQIGWIIADKALAYISVLNFSLRRLQPF